MAPGNRRHRPNGDDRQSGGFPGDQALASDRRAPPPLRENAHQGRINGALTLPCHLCVNTPSSGARPPRPSGAFTRKLYQHPSAAPRSLLVPTTPPPCQMDHSDAPLRHETVRSRAGLLPSPPLLPAYPPSGSSAGLEPRPRRSPSQTRIVRNTAPSRSTPATPDPWRSSHASSGPRSTRAGASSQSSPSM